MRQVVGIVRLTSDFAKAAYLVWQGASLKLLFTKTITDTGSAILASWKHKCAHHQAPTRASRDHCP